MCTLHFLFLLSFSISFILCFMHSATFFHTQSLNSNSHYLPVWPEFGLKSSQISHKNAQKRTQKVSLQEWCFPKYTKYFGCIRNKIYHLELVKIAQSGHTATYLPTSTTLGLISLSFSLSHCSLFTGLSSFLFQSNVKLKKTVKNSRLLFTHFHTHSNTEFVCVFTLAYPISYYNMLHRDQQFYFATKPYRQVAGTMPGSCSTLLEGPIKGSVGIDTMLEKYFGPVSIKLQLTEFANTALYILLPDCSMAASES